MVTILPLEPRGAYFPFRTRTASRPDRNLKEISRDVQHSQAPCYDALGIVKTGRHVHFPALLLELRSRGDADYPVTGPLATPAVRKRPVRDRKSLFRPVAG